MTRRILQAVIHVPKQGKEHHRQMVDWCTRVVGPGGVRWFDYDLGAGQTTLFHFYSKEDATAFLVTWGGKSV